MGLFFRLAAGFKKVFPETALGPVNTIRDAQVLNDNSQDKARGEVCPVDKPAVEGGGGRIFVDIQPTSNDGLRKMHQKMGMPGSVNRP